MGLTVTRKLNVEKDQATVADERRAERFQLREFLWSVSTLRRVQQCARRRVSVEEGVGLAKLDGRAHFTNLRMCGSISACPVCSAKIRHGRAQEVEEAAAAHLRAGGGLLFLTLTVRHDAGMALAPLWDVIADGFRYVISGRGWKVDREAHGIVGTIRAVEVTRGEAGWHPHLHVLLFTERPLEDDAVVELEQSMWSRWSSFIGRTWERALPWQPVGIRLVRVANDGRELAQYLAKVQDENGNERALGNELVRHDLKQARRKGRTPFAILRSALLTGDVDELSLWWEYERASKGRQVITWSRGLKARFAIGQADDDDLAAAPVGSDETCSEVIPWDLWKALTRKLGAVLDLLGVYERHGDDGVRLFLAEFVGDWFDRARTQTRETNNPRR